MPVYLDHNATTPLDPRVFDAMLPWLHDHHGNPSSVHSEGRLARQAIDTAREQVAELAGAHPSQVIFTSGGTEANNLAIKGMAAALPPGRIAVSAIEHSSVSACARALIRTGWQVDIIGVDAQGRVTPEHLQQAVGEQTSLVSVMLANNDTGVIIDPAPIAQAAREAGAMYHADAVQAAAKMRLDFAATGARSMSLSAHKIYGPKGAGALVLDRSCEIIPLFDGGGHERGLRSGTENVAGIVGFGAAAQIAVDELDTRGRHLASLRKRLEKGLAGLPGVSIAGAGTGRLPNTVMLTVPGIEGETLLLQLDEVGYAVSSGSACSAAEPGPNPVLAAMGVDEDLARCAIRVSLGQDNTAADVDGFLQALAGVRDLMAVLSGT